MSDNQKSPAPFVKVVALFKLLPYGQSNERVGYTVYWCDSIGCLISDTGIRVDTPERARDSFEPERIHHPNVQWFDIQKEQDIS